RRRNDRVGGAGVTILSRYTLRLLTIQQFRRALALITACELLRVQGSSGGVTGWRPQACPDRTDRLWGDVRFSAGLWAGGGGTPNNRQTFKCPNRRGHEVTVHGAIDILEGTGRGEGEPAQVLHCPACNALLVIPPEGFSQGQDVTLLLVLGDAQNSAHPPPP